MMFIGSSNCQDVREIAVRLSFGQLMSYVRYIKSKAKTMSLK